MNKKLTRLSIPDGVKFSDLALAFDPQGGISFNWEPVERIWTTGTIRTKSAKILIFVVNQH